MNEELIERTLSNLEKVRIALHRELRIDPSFRYADDSHLSALVSAIEVFQELSDENAACAGVWVDVKERMPNGENISTVFCYVMDGWLYARELHLYDGKFSFWEGGIEAFPTHWLDVRPPPGASK